MSAAGLQVAALLGLCFLLGAVAQEGENGLRIRPYLPNKCKFAPDLVDCRGEPQFRWYYNKFSDSCMVYLDRGCNNNNSFPDKHKCLEFCIEDAGSMPDHWKETSRGDQLDERYEEAVVKPMNSFMNKETNHRAPMRPVGRRTPPFNRDNFRQRGGPPPTNFNRNPKSFNPQIGFPPRRATGMPYDLHQPNEFPGRFDRKRNYNERVQKRAMALPKYHEEVKKNQIDLMSDEDILEKISLSEVKPGQRQPTPKKASGDSDFMSDSDIFETLPQKELFAEIPNMNENMDQKNNRAADLAKVMPQCMEFPETGPCRAYIRRWYFDPQKHDCFTFIFGGCEGNKNSFETKVHCMEMCGTSSEELEQASSESTRPLPSRRNQFGLRKQKNLPPIVLTSPAANHFPDVTRAPSKVESINKVEEEPEMDQSGDDISENIENFESDASSEETKPIGIEARQAVVGGPHVTNHYYTYHNYGPQHSNHGAVKGPSNPSEGDSLPSIDENKPMKKNLNKKTKRQKNKKNKISPKRTPFNMFFKFLRRLQPRKPKTMVQKGESIDRDPTKPTGVNLVTLLFTKRERPRNAFNPFSPFTSLRQSSSPFSLLFNRPEPREPSDFHPLSQPFGRSLPYLREGSDYNHGPPPNYIHDYNERSQHEHELHHHYDNQPFFNIEQHHNHPPFINAETSNQNRNAFFNPFSSFLMPSIDRSMSTILRQVQSPLFNAKPFVPHGEKNAACGKPMHVGSCRGATLTSRWYYDASRGICDVFFYNGCGGNENRFDNLKQCHDVCVALTPPPPVPNSSPEETNTIPQENNVEVDSKPANLEQLEVELASQPDVQQEQSPQPEEKPEAEQQPESEVNPESHEIPQVQPEPVVPVLNTAKAQIAKEMEEYQIQRTEAQQEKVQSQIVDAGGLTAKQDVVGRDVILQERVTPVLHKFQFANMRLDTRMEYILVLIIMILGGAALIVLVALTAYFMYKKHKLAVHNQKDITTQRVFQAHAYPEVQKISVIELLRDTQLAGIHDLALKSPAMHMS